MTKLAWKQITVAAVIGFLLGTQFGIIQARPPWMRPAWNSEDRMLRKFSRELKLTEDQKIEVKKIISESQRQMKDLRNEIRPKFKSIRTEMNEKIRALLTAEQLPRLEAMEQRWETRRKKHSW